LLIEEFIHLDFLQMNNWFEFVKKNPPKSWKSLFEDSLPELEDAYEDLTLDNEKYGDIVPLNYILFMPFYLTPISKLKVILVGGEPMTGTISDTDLLRTQGLLFSQSRLDMVSGTLSIIYRELSRSIEGFTPPLHGDLRSWAYRGVLLLHSSLTVSQKKRNEAEMELVKLKSKYKPKYGSYSSLWSGFIRKALSFINEKQPNAVFVLFGNDGKGVREYLSSNSLVIEVASPSPKNSSTEFIGNNLFIKINEMLIKTEQDPVDWRLE
jgi:uracil DNA glycosylase